MPTPAQQQHTHVITTHDGGLVPVFGHLARIEAVAQANGWQARGKVRAFSGDCTRWYSKSTQCVMAEFGRNSQLILAVRNDLSKITGTDRVGQFITILEAK